MAHEVPDLPYPFDALEPHIDRQTMQLHHDKHHATYVKNLNAALEKAPELAATPIESLLAELERVPEPIRAAVRNNGGGHANHSLFWQLMAPNAGGQPSGDVALAIKSSFGSFDAFKEKFSTAATGVFGSGWAWVVDDGEGRLSLAITPNQDSPWMQKRTPILGIDVWEHAYYLKYQNRRADYITAWWNVVNWAHVEKRLTRAHAASHA
jgi:Fe-Mn family superoxide dismutase